jgi:predicted PurR-regulated permease PerM
MVIAIIITVLLLWLVIGGMAAALVAPLIKQAASRTHSVPDDHGTLSESPAHSVSKT